MKNKLLVLYELLFILGCTSMGVVMSNIYNDRSFEGIILFIHLSAGIILCNLVGDEYEERVTREYCYSTGNGDKAGAKIWVYSYMSVIIPYVTIFSFLIYSCQTIRGLYINIRMASYIGLKIAFGFMMIEQMLLWALNMTKSLRYHIFKKPIYFS